MTKLMVPARFQAKRHAIALGYAVLLPVGAVAATLVVAAVVGAVTSAGHRLLLNSWQVPHS
jgi:hypothetical protein